MTQRYVVEAVPFGNTGSLDVNAPWCVVDMQPVAEQFVTRMGATVTEERPPPRRQVAFCMRRGHADMIVLALDREEYRDYADRCHGTPGVFVSEFSYGEWCAHGRPKGPRHDV